MKKTPLNIIIFILVVLFGGFYLYQYFPMERLMKETPQKEASTETPTSGESTESDEPEMTEKEKVKAAMEEAIFDEEREYNTLSVSVAEIVDGKYAQGGVSPIGGGPGGGMWFAKKVDGTWEYIWGGNGAIYCSDLEGHEDFPGKLIPECYDDEAMKVVPR